MPAELWEQATALPALLRATVRAAAGKRDSVDVARFLMGKGQHAALRRAQAFARGAPWAWKGDIAAFFASIPHDRLLDLLQRRLPCAALCACFAQIIRAAATAPGRGLPIGSSRRQARRITRALERGALSEEQAAAIQTSRCAHLAVAALQQIHGSQLERTQSGLSMGADRSRSQARVPRRLLLERGSERPGRQPQQEPARQPRRQPGVSCGEHNTAILIAGASAPRSSIAGISGPEGPGSWIRPPRQGVDQDCVQRPGGGLIPGGTEAPRPGGGLVRGVVAGPPILALRRA